MKFRKEVGLEVRDSSTFEPQNATRGKFIKATYNSLMRSDNLLTIIYGKFYDG